MQRAQLIELLDIHEKLGLLIDLIKKYNTPQVHELYRQQLRIIANTVEITELKNKINSLAAQNKNLEAINQSQAIEINKHISPNFNN